MLEVLGGVQSKSIGSRVQRERVHSGMQCEDFCLEVQCEGFGSGSKGQSVILECCAKVSIWDHSAKMQFRECNAKEHSREWQCEGAVSGAQCEQRDQLVKALLLFDLFAELLADMSNRQPLASM